MTLRHLFNQHRSFPGAGLRLTTTSSATADAAEERIMVMLLKVVDVQARLNVSQSTVYALIESGKLPCHRVGCGRGAVRVSEEDLQTFLAGCRSEQQHEEPRRATPRVKLKHVRL